ncbi:MAG TPA: RNA polymerase sigma factor [Mycobacteriales bacterium]|nr:RNA polymerase sigma factor [Mycobacteriales bacterium]
MRASLDSTELKRRWALVLPQRDRAYRVARARTATRSDAEDIATETLIRAVNVEDLREDAVGGLVSTIAIRLAHDLHRQDARSRRLEARCTANTELIDLGEQLDDASEAAWLYRQMQELLPREREALLHKAAGHTNASAAAALGLTYKSVESAVTRARGALRHAWQSTLGILVGLAIGIREIASRSQPVLATTSLAAAALVLVLAILETPDGDLETPDRRTGKARERLIGASQTNLHRAAPTGQSQAPPRPAKSRSTSTKQIPSPRRTYLDTGTVGDRDVVQTGAAVTGRNEDESTLQTLQRCLREGLYLEPSRVGCRPNDPVAPERGRQTGAQYSPAGRTWWPTT